MRLDIEQTRADAMLHWHGLKPGLVDVLRASLSYTDYSHDELEGVETGTQYTRDTWEGRLEVVHEGRLHGVVGAQWKQDEFEAVGEEAYVPKTDSTEVGVFLLEDFHPLPALRLELGARLDYADREPDGAADDQDFTSVSGSAALMWDIDANWHASLSLARSQRAPATEELYSNVEASSPEELVVHAATGVIEIGDQSLDQEAALNLDLSLGWSGAGRWFEFNLFYNDFDDYIGLFNSGQSVDETPVYLYQQQDAVFYGVEFESELQLTDIGPGSLTLSLFGDYIAAEYDDNSDVPRMPPARIGSQLDWAADSLALYVRVLAAADQDDAGDFETDTEGYTRWDAGVDYHWNLSAGREALLFLKWKNIGDEEIRQSTSFLRSYAPSAGRSVEAGLRYSF